MSNNKDPHTDVGGPLPTSKITHNLNPSHTHTDATGERRGWRTKDSEIVALF